MRKKPKTNQVYKHFKGTYYQIVDIAKHSETGEELVIYRNLFEPDDVYARPLEMFMSEVDKEKYPKVNQQYRFALVTGNRKSLSKKRETLLYDMSEVETETVDITLNDTTDKNDDIISDSTINQSDDEIGDSDDREVDIISNDKIEREDDSTSDDTETDSDGEAEDDENTSEDTGIITLLNRFLDEKQYSDKLDVFMDMRGKVNENIMNTISAALELELTKTTPEEQYDEILDCLRTLAKYECMRLR